MKNNFKIISIFLVVISLVLLFSACTDDTGIIVYRDDTSILTQSIEVLPDTSETKSEVITDYNDETKIETEVTPSAETSTQTEAITEQVTDEITEVVTELPQPQKEQATETIPDEATSAPETEKETEAEATEKVESERGTDYLLNMNSKKFHYLSCKSGQKTKEVNRAYHTGTRDEVIAMGYTPCKNCSP